MGTEQFVPLVHREVPADQQCKGGRTGFQVERPTTSIEPMPPTSAAGRSRKNGSKPAVLFVIFRPLSCQMT